MHRHEDPAQPKANKQIHFLKRQKREKGHLVSAKQRSAKHDKAGQTGDFYTNAGYLNIMCLSETDLGARKKII